MRMMLSYIGALLAFVGGTSVALADSHGNPDEGQKAFRRCASCHMIGDNAVNRAGPVLTGVVGAQVGRVEGFRYSNAFKEAGESGAIWDEESLDAFLENPRGYLKGNRMSFRGLPDAGDRANVIAYLRTFSHGGDAAEADASIIVAPEILAIVGDVEYREYLAGKCETCQQVSGGKDGVPNTVGLGADNFVTTMQADLL